MDTLKLGNIIENGREANRDATHIAVAPVIAHFILRPGEHVGVLHTGVTTYENPVGIIDPFLRHSVEEGERCWLYLYPGSITSLRHEWTHPAFSATFAHPAKSASEQWIRAFCARIPLDYDVVMMGAQDYLADKRQGGWGEYLCFGGLLEGEYVPDEFWPHYESVTGDKVDEAHRGTFFTCSC